MIKNTKKTEKPEVSEKTLPSLLAKVQENKMSFAIGGVVVVAILIIGVLFLINKLLVVATVNGEQISRLTVIAELEKQSGKKAVDSLISQKLILQEAKKQNVTVSDADIDEEMKKIEKSLAAQGQDIDAVLQAQGLTVEQLKKQIELQKTLEKMVPPTKKPTDKEIDTFIKENKALIPKESDEKTVRKQVADQLEQDKRTKEIQAWVADLEKKSKIIYLMKY